MTTKILRRIQSFVRRDGRMTSAQRSALEKNWPRFGLTIEEGFIDWKRTFQREAPRILEIGFGSGQSLLASARDNPLNDFIGIETYQPGIGALLLAMETENISNIRIYYADAVEVLTHCIPDHSLDTTQLFFPDPWPKRRHHKRRLIQPAFVALVALKLRSNGTLHLATDWEDYAKEMMHVLSHSPDYSNAAGTGQFAKRSTNRPTITKFEQRGKSSGRAIWELQFMKR